MTAMIARDRGLKLLLAAAALALLSGCVVAASAGRPSYSYGFHERHYHTHAPRWGYAPGWRGPPKGFYGHRPHRPHFHYRQRR
jgi:hypothetical protein